MWWIFPVGRGVHHVAKATGTVPRFVKCEKCGHGYGYWLTRTGYGHSYSYMGVMPIGREDRIVGDAEVEVEQRLKTACEAVPCPECGWYQKHMYDRAREERYGWLLWAGIGAGVLGPFLLLSLGSIALMVAERFLHHGRGDRLLALMSAVPFLGLPVLVVLGVLTVVGACLLRNHLSDRYNPNREDVEERKRRGWERAMSPKEYARLATKKPARGTHQKLRPEDLE
jgi:hypothetical protein